MPLVRAQLWQNLTGHALSPWLMGSVSRLPNTSQYRLAPLNSAEMAHADPWRDAANSCSDRSTSP